MFQETARNDPNAQMFSQSAVYSYTNTGGEGSRPRVYQATSSVRQGPGGVSNFDDIRLYLTISLRDKGKQTTLICFINI